MTNKLYIAATEAGTGKAMVVLGVMELLKRNITNVGFFRPIIRSKDGVDTDILLIKERYKLEYEYDEMWGMRSEDALDLIQKGDQDTLFTVILSKFRKLQQKCDFVLCEGTDFSGHVVPFEFDFNLRFANNLGAPILSVLNGQEKSSREIRDNLNIVRETLDEEGCTSAATIISRIDLDQIDEVRALVKSSVLKNNIFLIPEDGFLNRPSMRMVGRELNAELLFGDEASLDKDVKKFIVAAMGLENVLEHIEDGTLVITPGDREDVIIGSIAAALSGEFPKVAGLLLTGGIPVGKQTAKLIKGMGKYPVAIYSVKEDTFKTASRITRAKSVLTHENERKIAAALGLFEKHVSLDTLREQIHLSASTAVTPVMFEYELIERAKSKKQRIVLPEGTEDRILRAAEILCKRDVVEIILLGDVDKVKRKISSLGIKQNGIRIIDPVKSELRQKYAEEYFELRKHKGIPMDLAMDMMTDVSYFGTMMVHKGDADGMVSGSVHTTQHTIRPSFEIIKTRPGTSIVSSVFFMCLADRVLVYGDCAVNPNPNSEQLADIAISSADTASMFGVQPRVAMLSYSTGESGKGEDVEIVREAARLAKSRRPDLMIEGPIQYDAAVDAGVAKTKLPGSNVAGYANVFIFPDLNTGNNTYKAVQRSANAVAVGPVLQGLNKPVNDLSRGCLVADIVNTVAITAIQAQAMGE